MSLENGFGARQATRPEECATILDLLDASQTALIAVDSMLEVASWSDTAEQIFGWRKAEILGRKITNLETAGASALKTLLSSPPGKHGHFECLCQTKAGDPVWVRIWTPLTPNADGRRLLLMRDVTELKFLENAFLTAAEREQERIGREMHDHLCQHLLGAAFAVKALACDLDREGSRHAVQLHDLARLINEAVAQVRDMSRGFHPAELESGNLPAALQGLAARVSRTIPCEFHGDKSAPVKNSNPALHAYRIAQEAVAHALQETGATKISIRLAERGGSVRVEIIDDGVKEGPLTANPNSLGSKILQYRARAIRGQVHAKFHDGVGTHVICTFPRTP